MYIHIEGLGPGAKTGVVATIHAVYIHALYISLAQPFSSFRGWVGACVRACVCACVLVCEYVKRVAQRYRLRQIVGQISHMSLA